jgi:D-sedoheptulose 7-phosphate isomerase
MIYCFDIDGTICTSCNGNYRLAQPYQTHIAKINDLYEEGHYIKLHTARGSTTGIDWSDFTRNQLASWNIKYHELILGKPEASVFVDDRACSPGSFFGTSPYIITHLQAISSTFNNDNLSLLQVVAKLCVKVLKNRGTLYLAGNGGSYSDCLHFAAELTGRYISERQGLSAVVLGSNPSSLTAISNDYTFNKVFERELSAHATTNDLFIAFSTSGTSPNIIAALEYCKANAIQSVLFTGERHSPGNTSAITLKACSSYTPHIQECHIIAIHILCSLIDEIYG